MMQPITAAGAALSLGVLFLRYRAGRTNPRRPNPKRTIMLAKAVALALLAWLTVSFSLQHMLDNMDGRTGDPSPLERVVSSLSK
ncbi:MAG TPA: hypothetical protein VFA04_07985 [Bryobacteraceae bacterium]|jgi:hypothetical protein|nr:hypothetical protein [Bryobacteraceae bacterium]